MQPTPVFLPEKSHGQRNLVGYSPWNSLGQNTGVGSHSPSPADFPDPGIELGSPALQANSLPAELQGKPIFIIAFI